jgi:hypothetical protein
VQTQPQTLGYGFSVWSVARLNAHLQRQTGVGFSDDQLWAILREEARRQLKRSKKGRLSQLALTS